MIAILFILSGAAGLMYQVVWSRDLVLIFGNTSQSVSTVVAAFMAGLGFGGLAGARLARITRRPLVIYGAVECAVGLLALVLPYTFGWIADVYVSAYNGSAPTTLALTRFGLAFLVVTPVTFLMGMTLPLLTRHLVRSLSEAGPMLGRLYAANTLGATLGTLLSGFVLIELLGLSRTAQVAVAFNLLAGAAALVLSRRSRSSPPLEVPAAPAEPPPDPGVLPPGGIRALLFAASFVSGFVALALEILWTREVAEGTGSMIYLFVAILALYLVGITMGSRRYEFRSRHSPGSIQTLGALFVGIGVLVLATMAIGSIPSTGAGQALRTALLLITIVIATGLMGYAFPLTGRLLTRTAGEAGEAAGLLYAANTLGGILGSFAGTFILAGILGTPPSILALGAAEMLFGAALAFAGGRRLAGRRPVPVLVSGLAVVALVAVALEPALARTSTQNSVAGLDVTKRHAEDEIATVDAVGGQPSDRRLLVTGIGMTSLTVDTKLMAYLPLAARPGATDFLVVCFGMGSTFRSALTLGLTTDAVDLSPSVPRQMDVFFPDAERYLHDPRGRVLAADGRNYVRLASRQYDILVVDPPPPVESAGTVVLYTREFVEQAKARLKPGGIMMLWMQHAVTIDGFRMHLRTFAASFQHVTIVFSPGSNGTYFFGSDELMDFSQRQLQTEFSTPAGRADLADSPDHMNGGPADWAQEITAKVWLSDARVRGFVGAGPYITDDRPRSEYFLWHRMAVPDLTPVSEARLRAAFP